MASNIIAQAKKMRAVMQVMAAYAPDEVAFAHPVVFDQWEVGVSYQVNDKRNFNGKLYKCLQSHISQTDWPPETAISLWVEVADPSIEWPQWRQPLGAHDAYAKGDKVSHVGRHWVSNVDANTWEPGAQGVSTWGEAQ